MRTLNVFFQNYRTATEGLNLITKIFITTVLAFIFGAVLFALIGVVKDFIASM